MPPSRMYHLPGSQCAAAIATIAATAHAKKFDLPFHIPTSKAMKTAVNAKSSPHRAGFCIDAPTVCPTTVELTHATNSIKPPPSKKPPSRPPAPKYLVASAQLSSNMKKTEVYTFEGDNRENQGRSAAPINRWRMLTTKVVRMMVITGRGTTVHSDRATNCDAPAKTRLLISSACTMLNFAWRASMPKTRPTVKALIATGMARRAPSSAPDRVNVIFSLTAFLFWFSLKLKLAFLITMNPCYPLSRRPQILECYLLCNVTSLCSGVLRPTGHVLHSQYL